MFIVAYIDIIAYLFTWGLVVDEKDGFVVLFCVVIVLMHAGKKLHLYLI